MKKHVRVYFRAMGLSRAYYHAGNRRQADRYYHVARRIIARYPPQRG